MFACNAKSFSIVFFCFFSLLLFSSLFLFFFLLLQRFWIDWQKFFTCVLSGVLNTCDQNRTYLMGALANSDVCVLKFRVSEHYFLEIKSNGKVKVEPVNPALKPLKTYLHERDIKYLHITYLKARLTIRGSNP